VPYQLTAKGAYDVQMVIDVGHDRKHYALSLVASDGVQGCTVASNVFAKTDTHREAINGTHLAQDIILMFKDNIVPNPSRTLSSLLVLRDGRLVGEEFEAISKALIEIRRLELLTQDALVDIVDVHKDTLKAIRLWLVDEQGKTENALEGTLLYLNKQNVLLTTTGAAGLTQGTAAPILLVANGHCKSLLHAAQTFFEGAQLNWSSPSVPQRLHIGMKRTDEELTARAAQEIRRLK
jgi:hypothetical protein